MYLHFIIHSSTNIRNNKVQSLTVGLSFICTHACNVNSALFLGICFLFIVLKYIYIAGIVEKVYKEFAFNFIQCFLSILYIYGTSTSDYSSFFFMIEGSVLIVWFFCTTKMQLTAITEAHRMNFSQPHKYCVTHKCYYGYKL